MCSRTLLHLGQNTRRHCGTDCTSGSGSQWNNHHPGSSVGLLQSHSNNDDRSVRCRRRDLQHRTGQNHRCPSAASCRRQAFQALPARDGRHIADWRICQQHGHSCPDAAHRSEYGLGEWNISTATADAACFRKQYGRNDDTDRYASQPCDCRSMGRSRKPASYVLFLSPGRSYMRCCGNPSPHTSEQMVSQRQKRCFGH